MGQQYARSNGEAVSASGGRTAVLNPQGRYVGRIKSCDASKGLGLISCPEAFNVYGQDVSFLYNGERDGFIVGEEVSFSVTVDNSGRPQVRQLMRTSDGPKLP